MLYFISVTGVNKSEYYFMFSKIDGVHLFYGAWFSYAKNYTLWMK
jgi:hypothetical protein